MAQKKRQELERENNRHQEGCEQMQALKEEKGPKETELKDIHHRENHYSDLNTKICELNLAVVLYE